MAKHQIDEVKAQPVVKSEELPDYLKGAQGLGNENVGQKDLTIPRLQIVQDLSPELDADNAEKFIPGAEKGMIFNTLTRELFPNVTCINVFYRMEYNVFILRKRGGGFRGTYPSQADAILAIEASDHPEDHEIMETGVHFVLIVNADGHPIGEAAIPMTSTKLKVSRSWNALIRGRGENLDRFAGAWNLNTIKQKNDKGNFFNYAVAPKGWASREAYDHAKQFYQVISSGAKDLDRNDLNNEAREPEEGRF